MTRRLLQLVALLLAGMACWPAGATLDAPPPGADASGLPASAVAAPLLPQSDDESAGSGLRADSPRIIDLREQLPRVLTLDLTRDANEIWDRIRRGFGMPELDSELVAEQQAFYLNRPGFLRKVFERGGPYLYHIVDELERRGMPTELALLPMVESSYNPMAYSRARASGLWQFIPSTGRNFNLTQDSWVDERRDVVASTAAALDYLQSIYEMHGDWHLALASYNWGEGAVGRAIQRNVAEGLPAEYAHLRMPQETRNYVPKLQALKNIVARPELFDFELPYVANRRHFVSVEAPAGIDLAAAARLADMPLEAFVALNPGYNRPAIAGQGGSLVVPVDRVERFRLGLAELGRDGERWRVHHLKKGESLAAVAKKAGLSLTQLRQLNGLDTRSRVSSGYALLVPDGVDPSGALAAARLVPSVAAGATTKSKAKPKSTAKSKSKSKSKAKPKSASSAKAKAGDARKSPAKPAVKKAQPKTARTTGTSASNK